MINEVKKVNSRPTFSQAAQDEFVRLVLDSKSAGTFLDVGCNHPLLGSNTYLMEKKYGWKGLLLDRDPEFKDMIQKLREPRTVFVQADALTCKWEEVLAPVFGKSAVIDYMSFDIDNDPDKALARFPFDKYNFRVITAEHDSYRNGKQTASFVREVLHRHGYMLLVEDVQVGYFDSVNAQDKFLQPGDKGTFRFGAMEDWWIMPDLLTKEQLAVALSLKNRGITGYEAVNWCTREETLQMMRDAIQQRTPRPELSVTEEPRKYTDVQKID